ncbi:copper amine oxidase N-terminal domain-containing protein [Paenibacillus sp. PR3]|uniref:Copper amine oxidase N-terminal domain-containing protein n=1 Tax=Paenibacillus terricola TaxID=2763503 RepID=A0ABR8N3D2_9BACL|nr:copper amine oxidase N-terminal domain-containing protein [Paenibacillus terricola]MBD3921344.1 copper amine oxidase N-terminal domain-containing protein [Paenibacillus terricola]
MKWLLISICLFLTLAVPVSAASSKSSTDVKLSLYIDDTRIETAPLVIQGSVYIPLRAAMESVGAKVMFTGKQIVITRADTKIVLEPNKTDFTINDISMSTATPPVIVKQSSYLPIRLFGNALGYDVVYGPSEHRVDLRSPGTQAVIYGFVDDIDGQAIAQGVVILKDATTDGTYEAPIRSGFYRISVNPQTYQFVGYRDMQSEDIQKVDPREPFTVTAGQTSFFKLSPSQAGYKVTLLDWTGAPIAAATVSFYTSHGTVSVSIRNGVGYLDFYEPGEYNFNYLTLSNGGKVDLDILHHFSIDENGNVTSLNIVAYPPNFKGQVEGESELTYGNLGICLLDENGQSKECYVEGAPGGKYAIYLPDGQYQWEGYYDSSTRQNFKVNKIFTVANGKPETILQISKPAVNIHGSASTNEGDPVSGGYIYFRNSTSSYSAWVEQGKYDLFIPDGTYRVTYEQVLGDYFSVSLNTSVTVTNGKLDVSPDLVFYLS